MARCLLLVDIQNDYFPGGKMELVGIGEAATHARVLLDAFRKAKLFTHPSWRRCPSPTPK